MFFGSLHVRGPFDVIHTGYIATLPAKRLRQRIANDFAFSVVLESRREKHSDCHRRRGAERLAAKLVLGKKNRNAEESLFPKGPALSSAR
jgi:hypothetical protein